MEAFEIENLSFTYPEGDRKALEEVNLTVKSGEFVTVCGTSGCGKTTLLRLLKPAVSPHGKTCGNVRFFGKPLVEYNLREQTEKIGFVMQSCDNQIVTDKVWHELAFGLESLGCPTAEIRARVAEMASFFGIQEWFHKKVTELSGGQKQILNLASVVVMQPSVLILDEPLSQLDPIAAQEFLGALEKTNRELGVTVIIAEHRLEELLPISDRVIVMENGRIAADAPPRKIGAILKASNNALYAAMPVPVRIFCEVENGEESPITVCEGAKWLLGYAEKNPLDAGAIPKERKNTCGETALIVKDVWFRYEKELSDVIKGADMTVERGEFFAVLGGNGSGKTTMLSLISGINKPYRGKISALGRDISKNPDLYNGVIGALPQNPQTLFVKSSVYDDLAEALSGSGFSKEEAAARIEKVCELCKIKHLTARHPYDLSGGEQQRAALAKVLLKAPQILLLDEPTKGMDAQFKEEFADILQNLKEKGTTIIMVSHDIEFCAEYADTCALFFDGSIASCLGAREFFAGKRFYTTAANRMARNILPSAVLRQDVVSACGCEVKKPERKADFADFEAKPQKAENETKTKREKPSRFHILLGIVFSAMLAVSLMPFVTSGGKEFLVGLSTFETVALEVVSILEAALALLCFVPKSSVGDIKNAPKRKPSRRAVLVTLAALVAVPITIYAGIRFFGDRKYYFVSIMIIFEAILPFAVLFEDRKPSSRELVLISVLCAAAVTGRAAFYMLPQFKPMAAIVIITGVCFGGETGFLVGVLSAFVSNFFFGQGSWTPWQMFAFGIIGLSAGVFFRKEIFGKGKAVLAVFGFLATLVVYGGIMNPASVIMWQGKITREMLISSYVMGLPFDLVHAFSTAFFLFFISEPMIEKLERVKQKYGVLR